VPKHERTAELSFTYGVHVMRIAVPKRTVPLSPRVARTLARVV